MIRCSVDLLVVGVVFGKARRVPVPIQRLSCTSACGLPVSCFMSYVVKVVIRNIIYKHRQCMRVTHCNLIGFELFSHAIWVVL